MKYIKFIILLILITSLVGCKKKIYEDKTNDFIDFKIKEIEVYSDLYLNDLLDIKNKDINITSKNYQINTNKLGKKEIEVYYTYNKKDYLYKNYIEIKDTTPPLVFSGTTKTVELNYDKDICNLITYGDNYSGNIKCTVTGDYDLGKVGTYKLNYSLSDFNKNETKVEVTLNVKEKINSSSTTANKTKNNFKDIYNTYKKDNTEIGIDVSKWQGKIDFSKVHEAGATFVMMRLGVQDASGNLSVDKYFKENIKNAKQAGLKVGVYLYSIATSVDEAREQADFTLKTLDKETLDLPIVFDWESWSNWNSFKISFHDINEIANAFIKRVEEKGYNGMLYSSKFYLETIWTNKNNYPVWLAHYTKNTDYQGNYQIWQLCNNGRISGINGDVDIDIMYKK